MSRKIYIITSFVIIIFGFLHGYIIASLNHKDKISDIDRVLRENYIRNKSEVDRLMKDKDSKAAYGYLDNIQDEYDDLYGHQ